MLLKILWSFVVASAASPKNLFYKEQPVDVAFMPALTQFALERMNTLFAERNITFEVTETLAHPTKTLVHMVDDGVHLPEQRWVRTWDPVTSIPHKAPFVVLSDKRTHLLDTVVDFDLSLVPSHRLSNGEVRELSPINAQLRVSKDAQNFEALTKFTAPVLGDALQVAMGLLKTKTELTIMCVNIWNYNHWSARKHILADAIKDNDPDVIGFQEVRARKVSTDSQGRFQVEDLATLLPGYQFVFQPAMAFAEGSTEYVHEGLAIFSKYPIVRTDFIKLEQIEGDGQDFHQRICLTVEIQSPIGNVVFMTTHMSLSRAARSKTLQQIGEYAKQLSLPSVLVGDFNSEFNNGEKNPLLNDDFGFRDAWDALHGGEDVRKGWTFNSWNRKSRIDYILLRKLDPISISVVGTEGTRSEGHLKAVGGVKDMKQTMFPSDHMFLKVTIGRPKASATGTQKTEL